MDGHGYNIQYAYSILQTVLSLVVIGSLRIADADDQAYGKEHVQQ
jgi:hypothetical protein